ncbi:hypothetical protein Ct61P_08544 [Colletotrichum tofieldiae]|nr:hypothetical protein Ct61P_08544 [Colletotrichum tofieldiae]
MENDAAEGGGAPCWKIQDASGAGGGSHPSPPINPSLASLPVCQCGPVTTDHPTIDNDCFQQEIGGRVTRMLWLAWACITAAGPSGRITMPEMRPRSLVWRGYSVANHGQGAVSRGSAFQVVRVPPDGPTAVAVAARFFPSSAAKAFFPLVPLEVALVPIC